MSDKKYYITTTLPYLNNVPHVGTLLELVQGDAIARYLKATKGKDNVHFNTGVDEHGLKVYQAAQKEVVDTQEYCDRFAETWKEFLPKFKIEPDTFWRTTSEEHKAGVAKLWNASFERGDIYEKEYEGHYCVGCESFKTTKDLVNGKCPDHINGEIKLIKEKNYFFKLSKYKNHILEGLKFNEEFITPESKREELKNLILEAEDISISRLKSTVPWGIEVPGDPTQNIYVWFEALCNYVISCGYPNEGWEEKWRNSIQLCGPDNLRFQGLIWQGLLASFGFNYTNKLLVHGTVLDATGAKMSKSVGNVVNPIDQLSKHGLSAVRYYILAGLPTYSNCNWDEVELVRLYNAHLANGYGNLVNRVITLVEKNGVTSEGSYDSDFIEPAVQKEKAFHYLFRKFEIKQALLELNGVVNLCNEYITLKQPWKEKNDETDKVLRSLLFIVKIISLGYSVVLPEIKDDIKEVIINRKKSNFVPKKIIYMELNKINGKEILEFLTNQRENDAFQDISLGGFYFEEQEVKDNRYKLTFMSYFDNWGTDQEINGNYIIIDKNGKVKVSLEEPFEGDGSDDVIKEALSEWLKTHKFSESVEEDFKKIIQTTKDKIVEIDSFKDKKKIQEIIDLLEESLTYIK